MGEYASNAEQLVFRREFAVNLRLALKKVTLWSGLDMGAEHQILLRKRLLMGEFLNKVV